MKARIETNTFQRAFLAFFLILVATLTSCSKNSSSDESPAAIPPANNPAFDAVAKEIRQIVKGLEYPDKVGQDLAKMVSGWKCDVWKHKFDQASQNYEEKIISLTQMLDEEELIIRDLYRSINKEFTDGKDIEDYNLAIVIKDKKVQCLGYSQLFYILGNSIGLSVKVIDVLESDKGHLALDEGHVACKVDMIDGTVMIVDLQRRFISKSFVFNDEFIEIGNYWELKDKNNSLRIPRRIQILDRNGLLGSMYFNRGNDLYESAKYNEAIVNLTKSVELNPKDAVAYFIRGLVFSRLGQSEEEITDFTKTIEINPKDPRAYYGRYRVYYGMDKYTEAISDLNKGIEFDPHNSSAYYERGNIHIKTGQYVEAISDFTKAIEINPKNANAYYEKGLAENYLGHTEETKKDFQKATELDSRLKERVKEVSDKFKLGM